jgi:hypothetical protein
MSKTTTPRPSRPSRTKPGKLSLHPALEPMRIAAPGPFVHAGRRGLLALDHRQVLTSRDRGRSWKPQPLLDYGPRDKEFKISSERVLMRTRSGAIILSFMNLNERLWLWRNELKDALPGTRIPHYVMRSLDDGRSWQDVSMLHQEWTGEIRNIIQLKSGRILLSSMKFLHNPGRHSVLTYRSDDDGVTWQPSHLIDLGGCGHHGGVTEATIEEVEGGRVLMLLRTNWGRFWRAFSDDGGESWRDIAPSGIEASSAPGLLKRLASGRLLLLWNRLYPQGKTSFPLTGGDGQWSEVPVSNHREELSLAFVDEQGELATKPVVIARQKGAWLSYPRVLEYRPGELWLTTMQGGLCVRLHERDFF